MKIFQCANRLCAVGLFDFELLCFLLVEVNLVSHLLKFIHCFHEECVDAFFQSF